MDHRPSHMLSADPTSSDLPSDYAFADFQFPMDSTQADQRPFFNETGSISFITDQDDLARNLYASPATGESSTFPMPEPTVAPLPNVNNGSAEPSNGVLSATRNFLADVNYDQGQSMGFGNEWADYSRLQRRPFSQSQEAPRMPTSNPSAAGQSQLQRFYTQHPQTLQPITSQQYQFITQPPTMAPVQSSHVPNAPSMAASASYSQSSRPSNYAQPRQTGVSPVATLRRRHHRNQTVSGASPSGLNSSRTSSQGSRRRNRPVGERGSQVPAVLSPRRQRSQAAPPAPPNDTSPSPIEAFPMLTAQQRVEIARSLQRNTHQLGELLRTMHSDDARTLQMYEESLRRRRYRTDTGTHEPSPPPKGLDNQNDGRPEPKESEELTVNLECRICMSQLVDTVMLPCGHAVLCRWCADQHLSSNRADRVRPKGHGQCPMCRAPVKQKIRIYFS